MEFYRFAELFLYGVLRILPFLFLIFYTFRKKLRFSDPITYAALGGILLLRIGCGLYGYFDEARPTEPNPGLWVYVVLSILLIKAHFGKSLFTMLMLNNISAFTTVAAKCLEGVLFPQLAAQLHRWSNSLTLFLVELLVLIPLFFYIKKVYKWAIDQTISKQVWRYLWCIPMTLYIVWYRNSYFGAEGFNALALRPSYTFYCLLFNAGGMLIYTIVSNLINQMAANDALRQKEYLMNLQHSQYVAMQDRIEEARRAKHDIRKHIHVAAAYLKDKKYEELEEYLNRYKATLPEEVTLQFCENYAVNALLQYFYGYAKMIGTGFSASVTLPSDCGIPDETLTVALGNLLENAIEACVREGGGSLLSVRSTSDESALFFKIVNTCAERPKTDKNGEFLSSKRKNEPGIGLGSVRTIAEEYNGMMKAYWEDGTFIVSLMLTFPERK